MKAVFEVHPVVNGHGIVKFAWQKRVGNYLAITGTNNAVNVYDRHGEHKSNVIISLPGTCTSLDWDQDGGVLAVANDKNGTLFLWNAHKFEVLKLDSGMKEPLSLCLWARHTQLLAVGTSKGNLLLYNYRTQRKIPVLGKHTKKITCGAWSNQNLLALGSEDLTVTISNVQGDTLKMTNLRAEPFDIQFYQAKSEENSGETTVSVVVGHKTLFLYDLDNSDNPIELAFQPRYGEIVSYKWYGDGYIMIGFSNGFFVVISTDKSEIGQELFQSRNHKNFLSDVAISTTLNQAASCGDSSIKIHDMVELKEVYAIIDVEEEKGTLHQLQWTDDGQLLTVSTLSGGVFTYLAQLPMIGDSHGTRIAYLTSLLEVTIVNSVEEDAPMKLDLSIEPTFITLGPFHIAVGANDKVWIHEIGEAGEFLERSYNRNLNAVQLNGYYAAALFDGKVELHLIDSSLGAVKENNSSGSSGELGMKDREGRMFPGEERNENIACMSLGQDFLIYGTESGGLSHFFLQEWKFINKFQHILGITKVFPDASGTTVVFIDDKCDAFVYNPINDTLIELANFQPDTRGVLWENWPMDKHVFVTFNEDSICTYSYYYDTVKGALCELIGMTKLPFGYKPLMLYNGEVSCQTLTGRISIIRLTTHNSGEDLEMSEDKLRESLKNCLLLLRFKEAWSFAAALDTVDSWTSLAVTAVQHLDIDFAIRAYQQVKNISMVYSLQQIKHIEDRNLLVGYIAMFLEMYNHAQELFLASSHPIVALEMRQDLLHWNQALNLAKTLAPDQLPFISIEYAQQLEFIGDYANALLYYEGGITSQPEGKDDNEVCNFGIARMAVRTGDIKRAMSIAQSVNNNQLLEDCADIFEELKFHTEAGILYEKAECWNKAAYVYIRTKNWNKIDDIVEHVTSLNLLAQYAKACEADGHFKRAAQAYETAHDYENAVRINLDLLRNPNDAVRIVKECQSKEGAKLVAGFFQKLGDISLALQFLILSGCQEDAFQIAEAHNRVDEYAKVIGDDATIEDYTRIALHFESSGNHFKAGKFFFQARHYSEALSHLLLCSTTLYPDGEHIDLAIQAVGESKLEDLAQKLTNYLMGDADDSPKEAKYLFRLYMALEQYKEAARTALLIAWEEQTNGNYRIAHDVLFQMCSELTRHGITIPTEVEQSLMLLHSYMLIKMHVKHGDHLKGARMLIRVANNISKFPAHIVPILTSTVIECQRSGLCNSAFSYAAMLMRPEYREKIDPKWKKKIEQIVRKQEKNEIEEPLTPCPYCDNPLPQTKLDCSQCKNNIPYCIVTGHHMVKGNWSKCPTCKFPALYSELKCAVEATVEYSCPMCGYSITKSEILLVDDIQSWLTQPKHT